MMIEISQLLFKDFLHIYNFTPSGNIVQDLVMFLFIPTLVIIVFAWSIVSRIPGARSHRGIHLLFSIAIYLFIIFQGWYGIIANSVPLYFLILLIAGIFWFIGGHGTSENASASGPGGAMPGRGMPSGQALNEAQMDRMQLIAEEKRLESLIENYEEQLKESKKSGDAGRTEEIRKALAEAKTQLKGVKEQLKLTNKFKSVWETRKPRI